MRSRIPGLAFLTVLVLPAYCQSLPTTTPKTIADYILYDRFLYRVMWFEGQANHLKAQGKDDSFMRSWVKVHAGLSPQEMSSLMAIASDCEAQTASTLTAAKALAASTGSAVRGA